MTHRKKRVLRRLALVLGAIFLLCAVAVFSINRSLQPMLEGLSKARVEAVAAKAMNDAILDILRDESVTEMLLNVYAENGSVYLLQANSGKLNTLAADCAIRAQERIASLGEQGISIPIGTVSGISLLAGRGPKIHVRFTPAGAVQSSFSSEFRSAGINQTMHRITLTLTTTVRIVLPGQTYTVTITAQAPIAENIIIGDVPAAYTDVSNEDDLLNLIPKP